MPSFPFTFTLLILLLLSTLHISLAGLLAEPVTGHGQPLKPGEYSSPNTVPAYPVQTQAQTCRLDLSAELFGGVNEACGRNLDRSRCCPVLAAWLFAAHARSALEISSAPAPSAGGDLPMMPDDAQKCVNSLQTSLLSRNIRIPQPNATCDAILCFCGIRLHQISSLSCPAAFNVSGFHNATPTAAVKNLEKNCRNSSYTGCTKCLGALQKLKGGTTSKNGTTRDKSTSERAGKMFDRDCQLMGLTWLLAKNKTAHIPTVSAVLRAIMYSAHPPHENTCSPDQENMPLAVDSLQFDKSSSPASVFLFPVVPLIMVLVSLFV
ncbi:uncharacterized GPI-anchored protein At4g28100 [Rosa rugosa]|uniref:uncharacterized GPI-anchored protein At4g28100 n=1 Tax=Rosa rugosa TaxID=74645 RepID=UPI002B4136E6|nr:uncharacterized GPI-anchored protein At4g28100 [Rosa rugosa]